MEGSSNWNALPKALKKTLPHSKSAMKWAYHKKLKICTQKIWEDSPRYVLLKKTDPIAVSDKYLKLITNLLRKHASILTQLRTGHTPLAKYLYCIGKSDSPTCPACQQNDKMVEHLLLHCKAHQPARQILWNSIGGTAINIKKLLTTPKTLWALFHFIAATNHFHNTFREIPTLPKKELTEREHRQWTDNENTLHTVQGPLIITPMGGPRTTSWVLIMDENINNRRGTYYLWHMVHHNRE